MKKYEPTWRSIKNHKVPKWYEDCKFGIFIHWGLYSVPAYAPSTWELGEVPTDENWFCNNPYAEWYYNSVRVGKGPVYDHHIATYGKDFEYERFAEMWKAENFCPEEWADTFKRAGAKYVVMVTKHHDGFCLFPSKYTDFTASDRGPERDLVGELTSAVRKKDMKMGLYYSGIIDWQYAKEPIFTESDNFDKACPTKEYSDYAFDQAKELIDNYEPSVFWNDIGWPIRGTDRLPELLAYYYNHVEDGVVNDRFNGLYYDFRTKEYKQGEVVRNEKWEMCRGMGLSFGYNEAEDFSYLMSVGKILSLLTETVANNGNLLLNIGPRADGTIPEEQRDRLLEVGQWLQTNGEAIYGTHCSALESRECESGTKIHFTEKEKTTYVFADQKTRQEEVVVIEGVDGEPQPLDKELDGCVDRMPSAIRIRIPGGRKRPGPVVIAVKRY